MAILYHCVSARSFRPLWALEELGLPYELVILSFPPRARHREYLTVNPLGTVPLYVDGPIHMSESVAICQYLASRHDATGLAVAFDEPDYGAYLNWCQFGEATLTFPQTLILRYGRLEVPERRSPQVVEDYTRWFLARLKGVERALNGGLHLCASRFTVADISVGYALMLASLLGLEDRFSCSIGRYWQSLQTRESFVRASRAQEQAAISQGVSTTPAPLT